MEKEFIKRLEATERKHKWISTNRKGPPPQGGQGVRNEEEY